MCGNAFFSRYTPDDCRTSAPSALLKQKSRRIFHNAFIVLRKYVVISSGVVGDTFVLWSVSMWISNPRKEYCVLYCITSSLNGKYFCCNRQVNDLFSPDHITCASTRKICVTNLFNQVSIFVQIMVESQQCTSPSKIFQQLEQ